MTDEDFHPHPAADTTPVGHQIVLPPVALFPLLDLTPQTLANVARVLATSAAYLRRFTPTTTDRCLGGGTCTMDNQHDKLCMLCAIDAAVTRHLPESGNTSTAARANCTTLAKQLATDTIEANARHGGEVFVLTHLAELISSGQALSAARAAYDDANTDDVEQGSDA